MLLSLFSTILVLLVAFFQAIQGMFSALIMAVLAILSAAAAFALVEPVYYWSLQWVSADYALAACLMVIFLVCLIVTRVLADYLVPGNMQFPLWVDRIGGGLFGLIAGLVIVGMLCISVQMLPFSSSILGFQRVDVGEQGEVTEHALWLHPDGFAVGLTEVMAAGSLSGPNSVKALHADWLQELQWNRSGVQKESRHAVPRGSLSVEAAWEAVLPVYTKDGLRTVEAARGYKFVVVRGSLDRQALDEDGVHRFTPMQWRIVGQNDGVWAQYPMAGMSDPGNMSRRTFLAMNEPVRIDPDVGTKFDIVFEVPEGDRFDPSFVEYKRDARAALSKSVWRDAPPGPIRPEEAGQEEDEGQGQADANRRARPPQAGGGRVSGRRALGQESRFSSELPLSIPADQIRRRDAQVSGDMLVQGHIVVPVDVKGEGDSVKRFEVPENVRLLQLAVEPTFAKSTLGRARQFAVKTVKQYRVEDDQGQYYFPVGEYRSAEVRGEQLLELQYWPAAEQPERALREPRQVRERDLEKDGQLTYLFLIPPGRSITVFKTGTQQRDLTSLNLKAPQ